MSRNLSDSKQERDLYNRLARLEQQMRERGTIQRQGEDAIQMASTGPIVLHTSDEVVSGGFARAKMSLSNSENRMVFALFRFSVYAGSTADPGAQVGVTLPFFFLPFSHWTDWQSSEPDDGMNVVEYVQIENHLDFDIHLTVVGEWKYIVNGGTAVVE